MPLGVLVRIQSCAQKRIGIVTSVMIPIFFHSSLALFQFNNHIYPLVVTSYFTGTIYPVFYSTIDKTPAYEIPVPFIFVPDLFTAPDDCAVIVF